MQKKNASVEKYFERISCNPCHPVLRMQSQPAPLRPILGGAAILAAMLLTGCVVPGYPYTGPYPGYPPQPVPQPPMTAAPAGTPVVVDGASPYPYLYAPAPALIAPSFYFGWGYGYWYGNRFWGYRPGCAFYGGRYYGGYHPNYWRPGYGAWGGRAYQGSYRGGGWGGYGRGYGYR